MLPDELNSLFSTAPAEGAPAQPLERRKLQLAPRKASGADSSAPTSPNPSSSASRSNIFGAAQPVDTAAREQALLEAKAEKERADAEARAAAKKAQSEADAAAAAEAKKTATPASNPFGGAKPVDVSSREKEVEAKRAAAEKEGQLNNKMKDAKIAEDASANPKREWRRPAGPHAGLTDQQAQAPQSQLARSSSSGKNTPTLSSTSTTNGTVGSGSKSSEAQAAPRQIAKNSGVRKEGFSYSNIAGSGISSAKPVSEKTDNADVKREESKDAEKKSANPGKEWKKPEKPHAGLSDQQAQAPQSGLSGDDGAQTTAA